MVNLKEKAKRLLGAGFLAEAEQVSKRLGIPTVFLLGIMESESGMNPRANNAGTNSDGTIDYGLIQFNGTYTLPQFGITGQQLVNMSATQQLKYIERFYQPMKGKVKRFGDLYGYNLAPALALSNSQSGSFLAFKRKVEQAFTAKTGLSPIASQIKDNQGTKTTQNNISKYLPLLLFLLID
jgi:hypothetical protein